MRLGTLELLAILAIVLVVFGPSQLPKLTKMFGKSVKNFREAVDETDEEETADKKGEDDKS